MLKALVAAWPKRKPKDAALDLAAPPTIERKQAGLMTSFMMNMMKMMQTNNKEPLINVYGGRNSLKNALDRSPPSLTDRMDEGVRVVGTPPGTTNNDAESQSPYVPEEDLVPEEEVPVEDAKVPIEEPVKVKDPRGTPASVLGALLDRGAEKKKEQAAKLAEKRREEAACLKRPAAPTKSGTHVSSGVKKVKRAIPPLGCSKCRYLEGGCGSCRPLRDGALYKKK